MLQTRLQMEINGVDAIFQLVNKINVIIVGMQSFKRYFIHVGFPVFQLINMLVRK